MSLNKLTIAALVVIIAALTYFASKPAEKQPVRQSDYFAVYGIDVHNQVYKPEIHYYVKIPNDVPLKERLQTLADRISRFKFSRLPVNVMKIDDTNGKKVAIIDLRESDPKSSKTWRSDYFQGSVGGKATTVTLLNTFQQNDSKDSWIDEVRFYYNGQPLSSDRWDHIPGLCSDAF